MIECPPETVEGRGILLGSDLGDFKWLMWGNVLPLWQRKHVTETSYAATDQEVESSGFSQEQI